MDERALAERLITYDTSTLDGMKSAAGFVKGWLEARDVEVSGSMHNGRPVLAATVGPAEGPTIVLHGHLDVVPARPEQFSPRVLAITAGTTVDFPNNDITFHNVFSLSRVKHFDLGRYKPGKTGAVVFDQPGIVPVFCDIHSHMSAYILVFSHPFFSLTDDNGDYAISGIPPGTYTVLVWSELGRAQPRQVTLSGSETVEADFRVGRDGS